MMDSYFPIHDYSPFMKGMVGCSLGIIHVLFALMACGGGTLLFYFERLRQRGRCTYAGRFVTGSFQRVVLVAFILGALSGVAMWFVSIQLDPGRIGSLVGQFHWIWATEWTVFCVEVVAGYAYLRYQERLSGKDRLRLLGTYAVAAWFSLFWKSAILWTRPRSGRLIPAHGFWSIFLNSGFWPPLLARASAAMAIAGLGACIVIKTVECEDRLARRDLLGHAMKFLAPMTLMPLLGIWFLASVPGDGLSWGSAGSQSTIICIGATAVASLAAGALGLSALWRAMCDVSWFATLFLCFSALLATAGSELVCEAAPRPDTPRDGWLSQSIRGDGRTTDRH
jgi:hypothetical protein